MLIQFLHHPLKAFFGERGEFFEQLRLNLFEIETGFSLHVFLEGGADAFEQVGIHVHRHQIEGNVIFLDVSRGEIQFPLIFLAVGTVEIEHVLVVHFDSHFGRVGFENLFQMFEDFGEFGLWRHDLSPVVSAVQLPAQQYNFLLRQQFNC